MYLQVTADLCSLLHENHTALLTRCILLDSTQLVAPCIVFVELLYILTKHVACVRSGGVAKTYHGDELPSFKTPYCTKISGDLSY